MAVAGLSPSFSTRIESIFRFLSVTRSFVIFFRLSPLHRPFVSAPTETGRPRSAGRASAASAHASHASGILFLLSADHAVLRGEIALLERGPRTATVTTVAPSRLLVLDRDRFVTAVTGHRPTDDLARALVASLHEDDEHRAAHWRDGPRTDQQREFPPHRGA